MRGKFSVWSRDEVGIADRVQVSMETSENCIDRMFKSKNGGK